MNVLWSEKVNVSSITDRQQQAHCIYASALSKRLFIYSHQKINKFGGINLEYYAALYVCHDMESFRVPGGFMRQKNEEMCDLETFRGMFKKGKK